MSRKVTHGRVVGAGVLSDARRRLTQVVASSEVQQKAKELLPAAQRLAAAVKREWQR